MVKTNIIANFIGKGLSAVMALAFVPIYLKFLGPEKFGLIGIYISLLALIPVLDFGIGSTLNREFARYTSSKKNKIEIIQIYKLFELIYWGLGIIFLIIFLGIAPTISSFWLNSVNLSYDSILYAVVAMSFALVFQWMFTLYMNGLLGLQKQVILNVIIVIAVVIRNIGAALVLWLVEPTAMAFFIWVSIVSFIQNFLVRIYINKSLPERKKQVNLDFSLFSNKWKFTMGMAGISFMAFLLTQIDKITLSKMLSLEAFGYYSVAWIAASGIYYISSPFFSALYPKFSQLVKAHDLETQKSLYHKSSQTLAVILMPIAFILVFYSADILYFWTNNLQLVDKVDLILKFLVIGTLLNAMMHIPYAMQFAYGWTRLGLLLNLIGVVCILPLIIFAINYYSSLGAAFTWCVANIFILIVGIQVMHSKILRKELRNWWLIDNGISISMSILIISLSKVILSHSSINISNQFLLMYILFVFLLTLTVTIILTPYTRKTVLSNILLNFNKENI